MNTQKAMPAQPSRTRNQAMLALIGISAIWGFSYPIIKDATAGYPVGAFLLLRFGVAIVAMVLVSARTLLQPALWSRCNTRALLLALLTGLVDFVGFLSQTLGLQTTASGTAAFITALYVVIVPLLMLAARRAPRGLPQWIPMALSLAGLTCLLGQGASFEIGPGEVWLMLSALAFAMQIVLTGLLPGDINALALVTIQLIPCVLGASVLALADATPLPALPAETLWPVLYLGIVPAALATVGQTWAQRHVSANQTALVFCTEPVWGALAGALWVGERFTTIGAFGCALILLAMAWPQLKIVINRHRTQPSMLCAIAVCDDQRDATR